MLNVPTSAATAILAIVLQTVAMAYVRHAQSLCERNLMPELWFSQATIFMNSATGRADRALRRAKDIDRNRVDSAGRR